MSNRTDATRREFLDAFWETDGIDMSKWEAEFLKSTLGKPDFSPKQQEAIDRMIDKYGSRVERAPKPAAEAPDASTDGIMPF